MYNKEITTYKYVYESDKEGNKHLLGVIFTSFNNVSISTNSREYYVGIELSLEDILYNKVNANVLGINIDKDDKHNDIERFKRRYESARAIGIVYFPQVGKYSFLENGDCVLPWNGNDKIESQIADIVKYYNNECQGQMVSHQKFLEAMSDNPLLIELVDLPTTSLKRRVSQR